MQRFTIMRWVVTTGLVTGLCICAVAVAADEPGAPGQDDDDTAQTEVGSDEVERYGEPSRPRFRIGAFGGRSSGGTSVGVIENLFFVTDFRQGDDATFGGRAGYDLTSRFRFEVEYATMSPGMDVILTDLSGLGRTEIEFSDLDVSYLAGGLRFNLSESRFQPFLTLGLANVSAQSPTESIDDSAIGILYGAGLAIRVAGQVSLRGDVRGLRSKLELIQGQDASISNQLMWSVGVELGF